MRYKFAKDSFEIVTVKKEDTQLPYDIALDSMGKTRKGSRPYIFVLYKRRKRVLLISELSGIISNRMKYIPYIDILFKWIEDNHNILIKHWNREITDREALISLKKRCP